MTVELLPGVRSAIAQTPRLAMHYLESGPADGVPVLLLHGNLSTGRFFEPLMAAMPPPYRCIAPDMRNFGDTARVPLDATLGLADWADDSAGLLDTFGVDGPVHLLGWSTGGAAIVDVARARPVASLTFVDPVSPYGFGGVRRDGTPCAPDWAGSGAGVVNPEFVSRLAAGDSGSSSPLSFRNTMNVLYWAPTHRESREREDLLVHEVLKTQIGDDGYPGDAVTAENWPGTAPGTRGILNALSPKYCDWSPIVQLEPKPPVLWTHGALDLIISDTSALEMGSLGKAGAVPGWPGEQAFPPQPMVTQIRDVLQRYADGGGRVRTEIFAGSGHFPVADAAERWRAIFLEFLDASAG